MSVFRSLSWRSRPGRSSWPARAASLLVLGASGATSVFATTWMEATSPLPTVPILCGNEAMPAPVERYELVCALDLAVAQSSSNDQGQAIRAALNSLPPNKGLYFPKGRYFVDGDLPLRPGAALVGSEDGTHFINRPGTTTRITQASKGDRGILVEGLLLDNIVIQLSHDHDHEQGSIVRYNGFRQTESTEPQISTAGGDWIMGNVLWRETMHPGAGILVKGGDAAIVHNLIGASKWMRDPTPLDESVEAVRDRTEKLLQALSTSPLHNGNAPPREQLVGQYTRAVHIEGSKWALLADNDINVETTASTEPHFAAELNDVTRLTLLDNHIAQGGGSGGSPVQLRAPQDGWVYGNRFIRVPLRIVPGAPHGVPVQVRPTKFTSVEKNEFTDAIIETTQRVTAQYGAGDDDKTLTAAHDLEFYRNKFSTDLPGCLLKAEVPSQRENAFAAWRNVRVDNLKNETPAEACNMQQID